MSHNVLLEIGVEELPARFIDQALEQLKEKTAQWLEDNRLFFQRIEAFSTPRRLALIIYDIAGEQETKREEKRGPKAAIAKTDTGEWTKAAIGFSKSKGKTPDDMYIKPLNGEDYLFIETVEEGKATETILPEMKQVVESIQFPQTMHWESTSFRFSRPIRWIVALYDDQVIPFEVAGIRTGKESRGHRFLGNHVLLNNPLDYEADLKQEFVLVNPDERAQIIEEQINVLEKEAGFTVPVDAELLREVVHLIEYPTAFYGSFDESYLALPEEILITSMKEHQRYFPVTSTENNQLLPYFVSVRNGDNYRLDNVRKGNEKVLSARLEDADFFYKEDKNGSIEGYLEKLKTVIFQENIGTVYEKSQHTMSIASKIGEQLQLADDVMRRTKRAAEIAKFDLVTAMVNEFTELQGLMGEKYALYFGEEQEVALAIKEQYLPTYANGPLPTSLEGAIVSMADKLDTIVSCFSANLIPTGSQDPLGLRRQAIGLIRILLEREWDIPFEKLISLAAAIYPLNDEQNDQLQKFFFDRAAYVLQSKHIEPDIIQAVLSKGLQIVPYTVDKAFVLSDKRHDQDFKQTTEAFVRILHLVKHVSKETVEESLFVTNSEKALYDSFLQVQEEYQQAASKHQATESLMILAKLTEPIHLFFEHNMVMADDEQVKANRLALVGQIATLILTYADLTKIEWKQHQ
ncbi:MAG TPA: glycine--tRNA ligase subunit beta [Pseudogracilibacillus sp.]|nr:glycine--tRNA ligase subunit beta [Pseudogracilibacillus sp.]